MRVTKRVTWTLRTWTQPSSHQQLSALTARTQKKWPRLKKPCIGWNFFIGPILSITVVTSMYCSLLLNKHQQRDAPEVALVATQGPARKQ